MRSRWVELLKNGALVRICYIPILEIDPLAEASLLNILGRVLFQNQTILFLFLLMYAVPREIKGHRKYLYIKYFLGYTFQTSTWLRGLQHCAYGQKVTSSKPEVN